MPSLQTDDKVSIFYKDWGSGPAIVFSHGWPLSADAWDSQMLYMQQHGYRCIAHDRRGHGRSEQPSFGNSMNRYADDLAQLIESLDLQNVVLVGHSTGGGEVVRYLGRHGTKRVSRVVLMSAVPPLLIQSKDNPAGVPREALDAIRQGTAANRAQLFRDFTLPFFGYNRRGANVSQGIQDSFWTQGMMGSIQGQYECVKAFSETDFHADLAKIDVPLLIMQGDDDQIVPLAASGELTAKLVKGSLLKVYPGFPHGMPVTHADVINRDLLHYVQAGTV